MQRQWQRAGRQLRQIVSDGGARCQRLPSGVDILQDFFRFDARLLIEQCIAQVLREFWHLRLMCHVRLVIV